MLTITLVLSNQSLPQAMVKVDFGSTCLKLGYDRSPKIFYAKQYFTAVVAGCEYVTALDRDMKYARFEWDTLWIYFVLSWTTNVLVR